MLRRLTDDGCSVTFGYKIYEPFGCRKAFFIKPSRAEATFFHPPANGICIVACEPLCILGGEQLGSIFRIALSPHRKAFFEFLRNVSLKFADFMAFGAIRRQKTPLGVSFVLVREVGELAHRTKGERILFCHHPSNVHFICLIH